MFIVDQFKLTTYDGKVHVTWRTTSHGDQGIDLPLSRLIEEYVNHIIEIQRLFRLFNTGDGQQFADDDVGYKILLYVDLTKTAHQAILEAYNTLFTTNIELHEVI